LSNQALIRLFRVGRGFYSRRGWTSRYPAFRCQTIIDLRRASGAQTQRRTGFYSRFSITTLF